MVAVDFDSSKPTELAFLFLVENIGCRKAVSRVHAIRRESTREENAGLFSR